MQSRKKKILISNISISVGILCVVIAVLILRKEHRFNLYKDHQFNFEIKYPAKWTFKARKNNAAVIFYSPQENNLDFFQENVNVVVQDISKTPMCIKKYSNTAIEQMEAVFGDNMVTLESNPFYLAKREGHKFVFTGKTAETELQYMSVWTIRDMTAYQVTYTALASQYDHFLPKAKKMIRSFRLH